MKARAMLAVLATIATCLHVEQSAADDVKEVASGKCPVPAIALSPDGKRLAPGAGYGEPRKGNKAQLDISEVIVWDLTKPGPLTTRENPKGLYTYVFFSADGKTLITTLVGFSNESGNFLDRGGLRTRAGYQAWDVATGREIGSLIAPAAQGEFTTAAVSPDGKYLATVFNSQVTIERALPKPFLVRELIVWDLHEHKVKWKLPGVPTVGRVTWSDSLAFSPDGKRLAFALHGSGGPTSESTIKARPDQPDANLSKLKMLTLKDGKEPEVEALDMGAPLKGSSLQWITSGKFLACRGIGSDGRRLEVIDPETGKRKATFALHFPQPKGKNLPQPAPDSTDIPDGWFEGQSVLSADGTRLAAHFFHEVDPKKPRQNRVIIWDVVGRKVLGGLALPDDEFPTTERTRFLGMRSQLTRIALSGNGERLAIGVKDAVQVYDVAKISGLVKPKTDAP